MKKTTFEKIFTIDHKFFKRSLKNSHFKKVFLRLRCMDNMLSRIITLKICRLTYHITHNVIIQIKETIIIL